MDNICFLINLSINLSLCVSLFLSVCLSLSLSLLVPLFVSMSFSFFPLVHFLPKYFSVSVSLSLLVCLFGCYPAPVIILAKCFYCFYKLDFVRQSSFSSPIIFYFIFLSVYWNRIRDTKFDRHGLPLPIRCMDEPFNISTNYFVLFVLQRVSFCFCLFFKFSLATTTGVDVLLCLSFSII